MTGLRARPRFSLRGRLARKAPVSALVVAIVALASCGGTSAASGDPGPRVVSQCVPFARSVAGVPIYGNAADWWKAAAGRYVRSEKPQIGSVLVFRRTNRLPYGHVAVVSQVLSERRILLTHANWVPNHVNQDVLSIDVSPNNDWSQVKVWWPPLRQMGATAYPAYGFIHSSQPLRPDDIAANAQRFITVATRN